MPGGGTSEHSGDSSAQGVSQKVGKCKIICRTRPQAMGPISTHCRSFLNKVLLEHRHAHAFMH